MLLFLARLSFAAEESPTCGDGEEVTLAVPAELTAEGNTYDWTLDEELIEWGGELIDTTGPTITIRCPECLDGESHRWDVMVEVRDANGNLQWAFAYFEQTCPELDQPTDDGASCTSSRGGSVWLALLALALRRRRS